jgi:hypothetical protein
MLQGPLELHATVRCIIYTMCYTCRTHDINPIIDLVQIASQFVVQGSLGDIPSTCIAQPILRLTKAL